MQFWFERQLWVDKEHSSISEAHILIFIVNARHCLIHPVITGLRYRGEFVWKIEQIYLDKQFHSRYIQCYMYTGKIHQCCCNERWNDTMLSIYWFLEITVSIHECIFVILFTHAVRMKNSSMLLICASESDPSIITIMYMYLFLHTQRLSWLWLADSWSRVFT